MSSPEAKEENPPKVPSNDPNAQPTALTQNKILIIALIAVTAILVIVLIILLCVLVIPSDSSGSGCDKTGSDGDKSGSGGGKPGSGDNKPVPPQPGGSKNQAILDLFKRNYTGEGTYYGKNTEGTCTYGADLPAAASDPKIHALIALNKPQFMDSLVCGLCLRVHGTGNGKGSDPIKGDFFVFTKDLCPVCKEGDVDLSLDGDGRWDVVISAVQCPVGDTKIQYTFHGSNQWYVKLLIRNARIPIIAVDLQRKETWVTSTHTTDGHWTVSNSGEWQTGPINIKMTAANGFKLEDTIPGMQNNVVLNGQKGVQVPLDPDLPSA